MVGGSTRGGDRNVTGGDRFNYDRGYGFRRRGDRWLSDRWTPVGGFGGGTGSATGYSLSGPSVGTIGIPSAPFTVTLTPSGGTVSGPVTITPSDLVAGGTFTPATVTLTTAAPSATFTYTPGLAGARTISCTNNGGLINPPGATYTVSGGLVDGNPVLDWTDSSGNGHHATGSGASAPIFHKSPTTLFPVVRFTSAALSILNLVGTIPAVSYTCFVVMKRTGTNILSLSGVNSGAQGPYVSSGSVYSQANNGYLFQTDSSSAGFHVWTADWYPGAATQIFLDGTNTIASIGLNPTSMVFSVIGAIPVLSLYSDGDIAEIIFYNGALALSAKLLLVLTVLISTGEIPSPDEADALLAAGDLVALEAYLIEHGVPVEQARDTLEPMAAGDRANIEAYLGGKFAIPVTSGGTAVDPSTVAGLMGWWKADSLL